MQDTDKNALQYQFRMGENNINILFCDSFSLGVDHSLVWESNQ